MGNPLHEIVNFARISNAFSACTAGIEEAIFPAGITFVGSVRQRWAIIRFAVSCAWPQNSLVQ